MPKGLEKVRGPQRVCRSELMSVLRLFLQTREEEEAEESRTELVHGS